MLAIKAIILLATLVGCINFGKCAEARTLPQIHPDHPGKCWMKKTSTAYNPGDTFSEGNSCGQVKCLNDYSFVYQSCGVKSIDDPNCVKIDHDLSLPYPDCCVDYECTDAEGKVTRI